MSALPKLKKRTYLGAAVSFTILVTIPTILAAYYYFMVSADRFVSEFRYSVRGGALMQQGESGGANGGIIGGGAALMFAGDSFILEDYITSVQAFEDAEKHLNLREMLGKDGGDFVRRYDPKAPAEVIAPYWENAVDVSFDAITGITTTRVALYTPEDSLAVARILAGRLDEIVDGLSRRARNEMLDYVHSEFQKAEAKLNESRQKIEDFRAENQILSPNEEAVIGSSIIGELKAQIAKVEVDIRTLRNRAPNSPNIAVLAQKLDSLSRQLNSQYDSRDGVAGDGALAAQFGVYEELQSNYEFAREAYITTLNLKQQAEANATLNQAQLVVFVAPRLPTKSTMPDRWLSLLTVFAFAMLIWLVLRTLWASLRTF